MINIKPYLKAALEISHKSSKYLRSQVLKSNIVSQKTDHTPVTSADLYVESMFRDYLSKKFPECGFIGEEQGFTDSSKQLKWIIDPIDGTKYFIRGLPFFGTQLALMQEDRVICGVVSMPLLQEVFWATQGEGAYKNGARIHVSNTNKLNQAYLSHGTIIPLIEKLTSKTLLSLFKSCYYERGFGDTFGYNLIAEGKFDAMLEGSVKIWDIAASSIILEEAGGKITDLDGKPISLKTNQVLATNKRIHTQILNLLSK